MSAKKTETTESVVIEYTAPAEAPLVETDPVAEKTAPKSAADFAEYVQDQLKGITDELKQRIENIAAKFPLKTEDLVDLKETLKVEFAHLLEDVVQTSKEFKDDVAEISLKHKDHLAETLKRSKDHTVDVFSKINLSSVKTDDQPQA